MNGGLLQCRGCGALVDPTSHPGWELRFHTTPLSNGCGGPLAPYEPGPRAG